VAGGKIPTEISCCKHNALGNFVAVFRAKFQGAQTQETQLKLTVCFVYSYKSTMGAETSNSVSISNMSVADSPSAWLYVNYTPNDIHFSVFILL